MVNLDDFTAVDFKLLQYITDNPHIAEPNIIIEFMDNISGIDYRLRELAANGLLSVNDLTFPKFYTVSEYGKAALQDHYLRDAHARRMLWLKNAWIPILVSLAANILLHGIPKLLPLIIQWFSGFRA